jgi:hypothetical protein
VDKSLCTPQVLAAADNLTLVDESGVGGKLVTNYRDAEFVAYVFVCLGSIVICRLYKLTLSNQTQVTLQAIVGFLYNCKDF